MQTDCSDGRTSQDSENKAKKHSMGRFSVRNLTDRYLIQAVLVVRPEFRWTEAADMIVKGLNGAIGSKRVTHDFARLMDGATEIKCSQFSDNIITHM